MGHGEKATNAKELPPFVQLAFNWPKEVGHFWLICVFVTLELSHKQYENHVFSSIKG